MIIKILKSVGMFNYGEIVDAAVNTDFSQAFAYAANGLIQELRKGEFEEVPPSSLPRAEGSVVGLLGGAVAELTVKFK
jgi:hypothetical protein